MTLYTCVHPCATAKDAKQASTNPLGQENSFIFLCVCVLLLGVAVLFSLPVCCLLRVLNPSPFASSIGGVGSGQGLKGNDGSCFLLFFLVAVNRFDLH